MNKYFLILISFFAFQLSYAQEDNLVNWHNQVFDEASKKYGIGTEKAYEYLQTLNLEPSKIIVAVLDGGIDLEHEDLQNIIWVNANEIPNNGIDDDKNGYIDDVNGWNFIGGKDGNVENETLEVTRLYAKYRDFFDGENQKKNKKNKKKNPELYALYNKVKQEWQENYIEAKMEYEQSEVVIDKYNQMFDVLDKEMGDKYFTSENIESIPENNKESIMARSFLKSVLLAYGDEALATYNTDKLKKEFLAGLEHSTSRYKYMYNPDFEPRSIVGDNYEDVNERFYGNNQVDVGDVLHGVHVSGIIAAIRGNGLGGDGIANDFVSIMPIRMVANGDERDKDVANAIRYAVDNGAKIINMSFGKGYSPNKETVWEAMRYAESKNVLMVHASGNSNENIEVSDNFPTNFNGKAKISNNWIEVGASKIASEDGINKASFSNYGINKVDLFAPGVSIYATAPDNEYQSLDGTSMASPVVAGAAALLWAYFPKLKAAEVKDILMKSVSIPTNQDLKEFSVSGGIINLPKAVEMAAGK